MTFNPIKALNTLWSDAPVDHAATNFLRGADTSYKGRAIVSETISPRLRGRVYFQGSWWLAQCEQDITIAVDEVVQVIGRQNITLLVRPMRTSSV
ncbi:MAG: NfeD family protein [Lyngbya sp. HA4199-MV5]|nr:NfeD family protein [Lyngbya sp. HA4199-MV5]